MKIVGYTRTRLIEELGEQDLEEQERGIAEFCDARNFDLTGVIVDEAGSSAHNLEKALGSNVDGIVITDPLVIADDIESVSRFATQLIHQNKHLFVILHDHHIDPHMNDAQQQLIDMSVGFLEKRVS